MIQYAADVALAVAALGCIVFVLTYHLLADWRSTPLGRNVMAFMAACAILLALGMVRAFVGLPAGSIQWVRFVGFAVVSYIVWRRVYLLVRAQLSERTAPSGHDDRPATGSPCPGPAGGGDPRLPDQRS